MKKQNTNIFNPHPIRKFNNCSCELRTPVEVGHFSLDGQREYHDDASQLRYYNPPTSPSNVHFNLREGYKSYIEKNDDVKEGLTHLLMWIAKHRDVFKLKVRDETSSSSSFRFNTDFITWRGHLTKLLITPYQLREPWKFAATLYNGTIFISEIETEKAREERMNRNDRQREMCYWGYKFEDYVTKSIIATTTSPGSVTKKSDEENVVNSNAAYCSVFRTRLHNRKEKSFSIFAGAEVDCCVQNTHNLAPPRNYVELKTTRLRDNMKQSRSFLRYKLMKFWAQSFLSGLPKIVVGHRDDGGVVRYLKEYETSSIPHTEENGCHVEWDEKLCLNFLCELLSWLKTVVVRDGPDVVYVMNFDEPFQSVTAQLVEDGSQRFLPPWFTDSFSNASVVSN